MRSRSWTFRSRNGLAKSPLAVNISRRHGEEEFRQNLATCIAGGIEIFITVGLDPAALPQPLGPGMRNDQMPTNAKPLVNLWSAGQGIDVIADIPPVAELVRRLRQEYIAACPVASMEQAARLAEEALDAARL